jgi:hypothetical protein
MARVHPTAFQSLRPLLLSLIGIILGLVLGCSLPLVPSTLISALLLASTAAISGRLVHPTAWWGGIGLATGSLLGTSWLLAQVAQTGQPSGGLESRGLTVLLMLAAGAVAGLLLGESELVPPHRRPVDLLRHASSLTAGLFAGWVTLAYLHAGLDAARAFSSRLSTSLTILVVCLAVPGWFTRRLRQQSLCRQALEKARKRMGTGQGAGSPTPATHD